MNASILESIKRAQQLFQREEKESKKEDVSAAEPFLFVGLGNPGREYKNNRHNVGFMVIDALAEALGMQLSRVQAKSIMATGAYQGSRLILAKPQTYMNLSGEAVVQLVRFYKIPQRHLLLIHDDLDLPFGTIRLRPGGGAGGQKGVASTISRLGTQDFARLRIGIGRPPGRMSPSAYVLEDFLAAEQEILRMVLDRAVKACLSFVGEGLDQAMNQYNGSVDA